MVKEINNDIYVMLKWVWNVNEWDWRYTIMITNLDFSVVWDCELYALGKKNIFNI